MSNNRVFVLQKDLPMSKIGELWEISSDLKEYISEYNQWLTLPVEFVENNPDWFIEKKEHAVFNHEKINERLEQLNNTLTISEIAEEIRRYCDGTRSNDPQDWDLPEKASEILVPLEKLAASKSVEKKEQPKEWEIVAFSKGSDYLFIKKDDGFFRCDKFVGDEDKWEEVALLHHRLKKYDIHSVKRLSDGEVFSVGDECIISRYIVDPFVIKDFFTNELNQIFVNSEKGKWNVMALVKTKPPVKEDGFVWTDAEVERFLKEGMCVGQTITDAIRLFKQSKSTKEEKIEVTNLVGLKSSNCVDVYFNKNVDVFKEKYEAIKKAIEQVLNQ